MGVPFFEDSNALESLRSSDFDALSAYAEAIDNSIQAGAQNIQIDFETHAQGRAKAIKSLAFGDDGCGMDVTTLASCLKLGWSSRFNDRSGIGRFGVGMILGAIHECKRVEVYSRQKGSSTWIWTYIDLDEIAEHSMKDIPTPIQKSIPAKYKRLVGDDHGTLVVWSNYDRQKGSAEKIIRETHTYFGRTFRKFIWEGVVIQINGEPVMAHDPMFVTKEKTAYPNDPIAKEYEPFTIDWPINDPEIRKQLGETSKIKIRMSLLPEEFRPQQGSGGSTKAKERQINELQEGVSILREGREVFFGHLPYWSFVKFGNSKQNTWSFTDVDRWWGCEISFGAELDSSFEVKNIKRGARPEEELLAAIKEKITPTRKSALEEVARVWKEARALQAQNEDEQANALGRHKSHLAVERAAGKGITTRSKFDADKKPDDVIDEHLKNFGGALDAKQQQRYKVLFAAQPFTIIDDHKGWRGGGFWEVTPGGNKIVMQYNLQHEFFQELRKLEQQIENEDNRDELKALSQRVTALVDLLLISVAKAQANYDAEMTFKARDFVEDLNQDWGRHLKSFVKSWVDAGYGDKDD